MSVATGQAYSQAQRISAPFDTGQRRGGPPWGVTYHTTGSGLPSKGIAAGLDPFAYGIDYYRGSMGPTYLIGWKPGQIALVARDEDVVTWHAGESENDKKAALMNGSWRQWVSPATVYHFERVYGVGKNPLSADGTTLHSVIPSSSANHATIGVEMIPVTPGGNTFWAPPMRAGLRFTQWQHDAARALAADLARRYGWPSGWQTTRILGHESLNPIERHDAGGGWDPGWLRADPYVDMDYIRGSGGGAIVLLAVGAVGLAYLIKHLRR